MKIPFSICAMFALALGGCSTQNVGEPNDSGLYVKFIGGGRGDYVKDATLTDEGEVVGIGETNNTQSTIPGAKQIYLFKADANGNKIWERRFLVDTVRSASGEAIALTPDGYGFLTTARWIPGSRTPPKDVIYFASVTKEGELASTPKLVSEGNLQGISGVSLRRLSSGDFIALGKFNGTKLIDNTLTNITENHMARISNNVVKFEKRYATSTYADNTPASMILVDTRVLLVGGSVNNYPRLFLINDELGVIWDFAYQSLGTGSVKALQYTSSGFLGAGVATSGGVTKPFLLKVTSAGAQDFMTTIDVQGVTAIADIAETGDGGFVLVGTASVGGTDSSNKNIWVGKVNSGGTLEWQKDFGGRKNDEGRRIKKMSNGDYLILGDISYEETPMIGLIRVDKNGNLTR